MLGRAQCRTRARPARARAARSRTRTRRSARRPARRAAARGARARRARPRRDPSQPASRRASLIGPWTSTRDCRPASAAAAGGGSNSDAIASRHGSSRSQARSVTHGSSRPTASTPSSDDTFESTMVDVASAARSDSSASPGGIGPCHHTNVGRSVTSSESTALGSASRRAVRARSARSTPAASRCRASTRSTTVARTPSVPVSGDDRAQRPAAADPLERPLGVGDVLGRRRIDDQVERGGADGTRARRRGWRRAPARPGAESVSSTGGLAITAAASGARRA